MTANLKIGPCPKCGNTTFITTAHVTQTWLVDEDGDFIEAKSDCDEVTHAPDAEDLFTCSKCGAEVPAKYERLILLDRACGMNKISLVRWIPANP